MVIGGIRCRLEEQEQTEEKQNKVVYIQTLVVQPAYRRLGVGTRLLEEVLNEQSHQQQLQEEQQQQDGGDGGGGVVKRVAAHVWVRNDDGLDWYRARGFTVEKDVVEGYYRRLRPGGARLVWRDWICDG